MSDATYELKPVGRITVGSLRVPGQRLFLLQAGARDVVVTLEIGKEQVLALARGIDELLDQLEDAERIIDSRAEKPSEDEMGLQEPAMPLFTVTQMGLAYDGAEGLLVLVAAEGLEDSTENTARFWATPSQMRALSRRARVVVGEGRTVCPYCGGILGPGHVCPRGNGHGEQTIIDEE